MKRPVISKSNCKGRTDRYGTDEQIDQVIDGICKLIARRLHRTGEMVEGKFLETVLEQTHKTIQRKKGEIGPLIAEAILADPSAPDTKIAKQLKCAASSVYGVRKKMETNKP